MSEAILVVEDEDTLRKNLVRYLEQQGYEVYSFSTAEAAFDSLGERQYSVALIDVRLPGKDGITLAGEVYERSADTPVLLMTAYGSVESVISALRAGAHDYLLKPVLLKDVGRKVALACEHRRLVRENARLRRQIGEGRSLQTVIANSRQMVELVGLARQIAPSNRTVLIEGESGSGKEVMARLIHDASERREGRFVAVSVTAIPEGFVESCLFGHVKQAFPGADGPREGLFRAAAGGTLLLDDIAELSPPVQAKLLRVLEAKEVLPVGGDRPIPTTARILVASNQDLETLVREKQFRADLYFRLSALRLEIPPLRRHPDDIPALAQLFLERHAHEHARPVTGFDGPAMQRLLSFGWPGNVRQLSNVVERATLACAGKLVTVTDLPPEIAGGAATEGGYHEAMADFERALIRSTLDRVGGDRREAARVLGLSLATLYRRLEKLNLKEARGESGADEGDGT